MKTKRLSLALVLVAWQVIVSPLHADNPPTYLFQWGSYGSGNGQFNSPEGVALDSSNHVYVADTSNSRIEKFDSNGNYLTQWESDASGHGQYTAPQGIATDSGNHVYVTAGNNSVAKFDSDGNLMTQWGGYGSGNGQFLDPAAVAIDSSNNVYVADTGNNRIQKFDSNGNYLTQWGSTGSGSGQFYSPCGIAIDSSNHVYVADQGNNRIEKFDGNGNYLTQWGSTGNGDGQFNFPFGLAVDGSNHVYVADQGNHRIEKFDGNGNYLTQWGSSGGANGQFQYPSGIAVNGNGNFIYAADSFINRIEVFVNNTNIIPPVITSQPASQSVLEGGNVTFSVTVIGAPPLAYQWTSNNVALANATNSTFTLVNTPLSDSATYAVRVTNIYGGTISGNAVLTVIPLYITNQPASQTVLPGSNVTFSVSVVGTAPLVYQWTSNNVALPNATNNPLTLTNVTVTATYAALVTNAYSSVLSSNALLTVVPAFVATLPASGISATGAVLNGSVTVGSDETVAWFSWGTDTTYGNIAGTTIVPGSSGSNYISAALNGLPGNIYHYRTVAANDVGIVYGNDQSFTVGFAPTATTLPPVVTTNGATLYAAVNPEGWDTTVYFKWGRPGYVTNTTPGIDAGLGGIPLNVSSFITGLAPGSNSFQVVASNHLGSAFGAIISFFFLPLPPFTSAPPGQWKSIASSADGNQLVAACASPTNAGVYLSTNSGATWTQATNGLPTTGFQAVASSAVGTRLAAGISNGSIYISTNSGATWGQASNAPIAAWNALAFSADGNKLAAVAGNVPGVYTSTNSGVNWTLQTNGLAGAGFNCIGSSADGNKLIAAGGATGNGRLYTSINGGVTWMQATNGPGRGGLLYIANWSSVASSADGNQLLASPYSGSVLISTNSGVTWTATGQPSPPRIPYWNSVAESADGTKLVALANNNSGVYGVGNGGIWTSTNSGATWVSNKVISAAWTCAAMSADGNELVAAIGYPSTTGGILVLQTTPAPVLSLQPANGNLAISWIIPSQDFTLQQSADLSDAGWQDVTNVPVLNLTNLQNHVLVSSTNGSEFYRLKNP